MTPEKEINKERVSSLLKDWGVENDEEINEFLKFNNPKIANNTKKINSIFDIKKFITCKTLDCNECLHSCAIKHNLEYLVDALFLFDK